jgi:uncharacterized LabA/DUF88 family protein
MKRVRIFIDHANFTIAWRKSVGRKGPQISWERLPEAVLSGLEAHGFIKKADTDLRGISVYASTRPDPDDLELRYQNWLHYVLDQLPGYTVKVSLRQPQQCSHDQSKIHYVEKGVDTKIACDMLSSAMRDLYDLAVLVSNDADLIPSVECVQDVLDKQVVHLGFKGFGGDIRSSAWGHFTLDSIRKDLEDSSAGGRQSSPPDTLLATELKSAMAATPNDAV